MSDDKNMRAPQDSKCINMNQDYEVQYWTQRFGVSRDELQRAVDKAGRWSMASSSSFGAGRLPTFNGLQESGQAQPLVNAFSAELLAPSSLVHATPSGRVFREPGWIFEDKLDGFRAFVRKSGSRIDLLSRNAISMCAAFPEIVRAIAALPCDVVLDAELVVADERGMPSWDRLRRRARMKLESSIRTAAAREPATLCVFDCLAVRNKDVRAKPLRERKAVLEDMISNTASLRRVGYIDTEGEIAFAAAVEFGTEGIVAKRLSSPYQSGRSLHWRKIKNPSFHRVEAIKGFR